MNMTEENQITKIPVQSDSLPKDTQCLPKETAALARYREGVEELWKLKSGKAISNGEHAHAAVLFASFFTHAEKQVRILCNNLSKDVFGRLEVVRAAQSALNRGVSIDIILQEEPESSEFKDLLDNKLVRFKKGNDHVNSFDINFAVMDDSAIRVEPDRNKCEAKAIMYDPKNGKILSSYFDKIWEMLKSPSPKAA
jgi:hypothetical protein